jgi:hypothetical protein
LKELLGLGSRYTLLSPSKNSSNEWVQITGNVLRVY